MAFEGQTGDWTREVGDRDGRGVGKDTYKEQGKSASTSLVILRESWKGEKKREIKFCARPVPEVRRV